MLSRPRWLLLRGAASAPGATGELAAFDPAVRAPWAWRQPSRVRAAWTLQAGEAPVLALELHGALGRAAIARTASTRWDLALRFPADVVAIAPDAEAPGIRYRSGWLGGGRFERGDRATLLLRREDFWRPRFGIQTGERLPLVHLELHHAMFGLRRESGVELEDAARRLPDLAPLLAILWLLALRARRSAVYHY
jgi:hypothetical protein